MYAAWGQRLAQVYVSNGGTSSAHQPVGFGGQWGYYRDDPNTAAYDTGLLLLTARYYDPGTGRFLTRDPLGYAGGENLYGFAGNNPVNDMDPEGLDWLNDWANFWAGAGDSLTFGATALARQGLGADEIVDKSSGAYVGGEATEMGVEVVATGGSALLKKRAERAVARGIASGLTRRQAKAAIRDASETVIDSHFPAAMRNGRTPHHANPLSGHPIHLTGMRPVSTLFPTAGLPASINGSKYNILLLAHAQHMAAHRRLLMLERGAKLGFNRYAIPVRAGLDVDRPIANRP